MSALPGSKVAYPSGSCSIREMPQSTRNISRLAVIVGSARTDGNTAAIVSRFVQKLPSPPVVANLAVLKIAPFEYGCHGRQDDFQSVIGSILASDHVIFATPVYWYAMAAAMKSFFDRLTDLLVVPNGRKIGRALAGRSVWLLSTGTDETLPPGFEEPFARTARYFDMIWREAFYCRSIKGARPTDEALSEVDRLAELTTS